MITPSPKENYLPKVRQQYEELPYPPRDPQSEKERLILTRMDKIDAVNHYCYKGQQDFKNYRVLIAGGGTGDSSTFWGEQLRNFPDSKVIYLDLSEASMKVAQERAEIRGLTNIEWMQGSLLDLPTMGLEKFDFINCSGVLHHLEDPDAGLNALRDVLKPDGAMGIMVYAKYGRTGVYHMQELMRAVNFGEEDTQTKINNTRKVMTNMSPNHHFVKDIQSRARPFSFNLDAELYDLFLHSQDRCYTILEAHDWLEHCGLKMPCEPGLAGDAMWFRPETFIKDPTLLEKIKTYPVKIQQAIAENMTAIIDRHYFYAVHENREDTTAHWHDKTLIPSCSTQLPLTFPMLKDLIAQNPGKPLEVTINGQKMALALPQGKLTPALLSHMDGTKSMGEIFEAVIAQENTNEQKLEEIFGQMYNQMEALSLIALRTPDISPFATMKEMQERVS